MPERIATIVALAGLAVAMAGLWYTMVRDRRAIAASRGEHDARIRASRIEFEQELLRVRAERDSKVELRLERLDTKMETVWGAFTAQLLTFLHHPDPAKIIPDVLLEKYKASITNPDAITLEELNILVTLMIGVMKNDKLLLEERGSAEQLLRLIRHHPKWAPTEKEAADLEKVIGPDLHPRTVIPTIHITDK